MDPSRGSLLLSLRVLTAVLLLINGVHGIPLSGLLPFGTGPPESIPLPSGNGAVQEFAIQDTLLYSGTQVSNLVVHDDGIIVLEDQGSNTGFILAFSADVDTTTAGTIYHGLRSGDIGTLEQYVAAAAAIDNRFAACYDRVFTVTWDSVGYFFQHDDLLNTFQAHIVYNSAGTETLVILLYPENGINWTTGDGDLGMNGLGGNPATVGLINIQEAFEVPQSGTPGIVNIESSSNVGVPGVFVFRVDSEILEPDATVGGIDLSDLMCDSTAVSGSGVSGVPPSGSGMRGCVFAGFTTCCVPSATQTCVVNDGHTDMCSCDAGCFANDNCCFDITEVPCLPDIFVEFAPQNYTVVEGEPFVTVNVSASGFPEAPFDMVDNISVLLTTEDGSAEVNEDYNGVMRVLNFSEDGYWEVMIPIFDNSPVEVSEFFRARLSTASPFVVFNNDVSTIIIIDNDRLLLVLEDPDDASESDQTAQVCVSVVNGFLQPGVEVTVTLETFPIDPEDADDFGNGPFQLIFGSGDSIRCAPVPIRSDNIIEGDETFSIFVTDASPMVDFTVDTQEIIIIDSTVGILSLVGPPVPAVESSGLLEVCAIIPNVILERDVAATITTSPSLFPPFANDPDDYIGGAFLLLFERASNTACLDIDIVMDDIFEDDEIFLVTVSSDDPAISTGTLVSAPAIILDETEIPFDFVIPGPMATYFVPEAFLVARVCVQVIGILDREVSLSLSTSDIIATDPDDYVFANVALLFTATDSVVCADIRLEEDDIVESPENFAVNLDSADMDVQFVRDMGQVFIVDTTQVELSFEQTEYNVQESDGSVVVCVTQTTFPPVTFSRDVTVTFDTFDGTATAQMDFSAVVGEEIEFPSMRCIEIDIDADGEDEPDESFTVVVTSSDPAVLFGNDLATVNIVNDPAPVSIGIEFDSYSVGETDGSISVCVIATGSLTQDVDVSLLSSDGSAESGTGGDYEPVSGPLVLQAGNSPRACVNVIILNDAADEMLENFFIDLSVPGPFTVFRSITTVVILDDDEVQIGFLPALYIVDENDGNVRVCASVDRPLERDGVQVVFDTRDGTAVDGSDYTDISQSVFFNSGDTEMCVDIVIIDNNVEESFETFFVDLLGSAAAGGPAEVTILDDDEGLVQFAFGQATYFVNEGEVLTVMVLADRPYNNGPFLMTVQSQDQSAQSPGDYDAIDEDLIFSGGVTSRSVTVRANSDMLDDPNEQFQLLLVDTLTLVVMSTATVIIINVPPPPVFGFENAQGLVFDENAGDEEVCVILVSGIISQNTVVEIRSGQPGDTATADSDYISVSETFVFMPGGSTRMCFNIRIIDDPVAENSEFFTLTINFQPSATVTINDNDGDARIGLELASYIVNEEDEAVQVCASITSNQDIPDTVTAAISTADQSAMAGSDYTSLSTTLSFTDGDLRMCVEIDLIDDNMEEGFETFLVLLSSNDLPVFRSQATVSILQDRDGPLTITLQEPIMAVDEGSAVVSVCADFLGTTLTRQVIVTLTTNTGTAQEDIDYIGESTNIIYFPTIEEIIICEDVTITDDPLEEPFEMFGVTLTTVDPDATFLISSGVVIVVDDDASELTAGFVQTDVRVLETDSGDLTSARLRAFVNGRILQPIALELSIEGGTATEGVTEDYVGNDRVITFNSNSDNAQREFYTIIGDDVIEPDETILFELSTLTGGVSLIADRRNAVATILNDDSIPPENGAIVLMGNTPEVGLEAGGLTVSVRVEFTLGAGATSATCALDDLRPAQDCSSGAFVFTGLPADRRRPLFLEITATDATGQQLAFITRPVRLGFNGDCAVNFVNGVEEARVFQDLVFIEFEIVGPVTGTECQLDTRPFIPCTSPAQFENLSVGEHSVKVRPNGAQCVRRIRRTAVFNVV